MHKPQTFRSCFLLSTHEKTKIANIMDVLNSHDVQVDGFVFASNAAAYWLT